MKLRKIKWSNHPVLGNLELDFTNPAGNACDAIVIAGENGLGKTTILETIYQFLREGTITPFEYLEYEADGNMYKAFPLDGAVLDSFFNIEDCNGGNVTIIRYNRNNNAQNIAANTFDPRHYGCAYTKAKAMYETKKITSIGASTLDNETFKDKEENPVTLKQLLIDVQSQDNTAFRKYAQEYSGETDLDETFSNQYAKMKRFSSAFNSFFDHLKYKSISQTGGAYKILFEKHGHEIELDHLSTGEKQIVFRGAYLLKNQKSVNGGIVLIDEPEISMHPLWQKKILYYYQNLFIVEGDQQTQLIVATHSEGVVSSAVKEPDKAKVIVLKEDSSTITLGDDNYPLIFDGNANEINYQAFGINNTEYHDALYGYIEMEHWFNDFKNRHALVPYNKLENNGTITPQNVSLSTKIRHIIHHPENTHNSFTEADLQESIQRMRNFILDKRAGHI